MEVEIKKEINFLNMTIERKTEKWKYLISRKPTRTPLRFSNLRGFETYIKTIKVAVKIYVEKNDEYTDGKPREKERKRDCNANNGRE